MKRIAVIAHEYPRLADRFLAGYPRDGAWHRPATKIVATTAPNGERGIPVYPSTAEALRVGVDAVLMEGVPASECIAFLEKTGAGVPLYTGTRLAPGFEQAQQVVAAARRLRFPLMASSALPAAWRLPELELAAGCEIEQALVVGFGGMAYEALEALQAMVERRKGGETGIRSAEWVEGEAVWKDRRWSRDLASSALSRSDTPQGLTLKDGRTQDLVGNGELPRLVAKPQACFLEYRDGLRAALLMLDGAIKDFTFAARLRGQARPVSTQFFRGPEPNETHIARLAAKIEEFFETGKAPYPVERALLVSGILDRRQALDVRYRV